MNRRIGNRLYDHFGNGPDCIPKQDWLNPVRYFITIAVPSDLAFEAPALEEFLIKKLHPKLNATGK